MPRVHFVKKARKDNPVVKAGESYYWWAFRGTAGKRYYTIKRYSATSPRRSQLTQSDFLSQLYDIEDDVVGGFSDCENVDDLQSAVEDACDQIRALGEEQNEKRDNMPEGLQEGDVGQLLEDRYNNCDGFATDLEGVDLNFDEEGEESLEDWLQSKIDELQSCSYQGS